MPEKVKINKHYIWDILEVDWKEVKVTFNGKVLNLPKSITIKLQDKFKVTYDGKPTITFSFNVKAGIQLVYITLKRCSDRKFLKEKINIIEMA